MSKKPPETLAARVKRLRTAAGFTQHTLAVASGLSPQAVRWIEQRPDADPKWSSICKLADAIGCRLDELRTG